MFVREGDAWRQQAKLLADDAEIEDNFGTGLDLSGDTIIVGAPGDDDAGTQAGSVYFFERIGEDWSQSDKLVASDASFDDEFGASVAISGDTALVSAVFEDTAET